MKKMFDRDGFVFSGLNKKQKVQNLCVSISVILFFILSAVTMMNALYCLSDILGSVICRSADKGARDALRSLPIFLSFFLSISGLMTVQAFYRNESSVILRKKASKHAILGLAIGGILIVYVFTGLFTGRYLSITEGAPTPIYPLDTVLFALIFLAIDIAVLLYFKKKAAAAPFEGPSRIPETKRGKDIRCFFRTFWLFLAIYGFCGFFYSFFIVDFSNGYVPYSLSMMLASLGACLSIFVWEFYYNNLTAEKRSEVLLSLALISLCVSLTVAILYFMALKNNLDGPSNVGFGMLPIAYASGLNIATLFVVATPLIVSVTALIKALIRKGKLSHTGI